jgi:hypothetical protein
MAVGERHHETGREGAYKAKLWLESTTRFTVPWNAYDTAEYVTAPQLDGTNAGFDLAGEILEEDGTPRTRFLAEVKHYKSEGGQTAAYKSYLATCYSATARLIELGQPVPDFMWITWHPFGSTRNYLRLWSPEYIHESCEEHKPKLGSYPFDAAVAARLSERLWFLLASPKLDQMVMSRTNLGYVKMLLTRGGY